MFARHFIHIALGLMLHDYFTWSMRGIGSAVLVALVSPVVALLPLWGRSIFRTLSDVERATRQYHELPASRSDRLLGYLLKVGWYTALTLVVAHVTRSQLG